MRYVYGAFIGILVTVLFVFTMQNGGHVTVSFVTVSATLPLAMLVFMAYIGGMLTGGSLTALVRGWCGCWRSSASS